VIYASKGSSELAEVAYWRKRGWWLHEAGKFHQPFNAIFLKCESFNNKKLITEQPFNAIFLNAQYIAKSNILHDYLFQLWLTQVLNLSSGWQQPVIYILGRTFL
ncbi:hypothetical protein ACJX0J_031628, partial [Zea mays]